MPQRRLGQGISDERGLGVLSRFPDAEVLSLALKPASSGSVCVLASTVGVLGVMGVIFEVTGVGEEPGKVISSPNRLVGLGVIVGGRKGRAGLRASGGLGFAGGDVGVVVFLVGVVGISPAGVMGVVTAGVVGSSSMGVEKVSYTGVLRASSGGVSSAGVA